MSDFKWTVVYREDGRTLKQFHIEESKAKEAYEKKELDGTGICLRPFFAPADENDSLLSNIP